MDPIFLCTWYQMDKLGWFVRDVGRVFDAFTNELLVGGFFAPSDTADPRRVRVSVWRLLADGVEAVGGSEFEVQTTPRLAELVLRTISFQSRLSPGIYQLELEIVGEALYETTFETRNRRGPDVG